jgi:hypothetical protein
VRTLHKLRLGFIAILIVLITGGGFAVLRKNSDAKDLAAQTQKNSQHYASTVHPQANSEGLSIALPATLMGQIESPSSARASGYLLRWTKDIGSAVKKGDLLAEISSPELEQQLNQAQASKQQLQSALSLAKVTLDRWHALLDQKAKEKNVYILPLSISVNCFILGKNEEALNWIRTILNDDRNSIRNDIYNFSAIFNLMIHYELGNFSLLEYQQQSLQRYLNEQGKNSDFETLVPNLLKKMAERKPGREVLKKLLGPALDKLREIAARPGFESTFIKQFYIIEWFESKLNRKSFLEQIRLI